MHTNLSTRAPSDLLVHLGDHRVGEREGHGDELTLTVES